MTAVPAEISASLSARNPDVPEAGQLVRVPGQQWVVSHVNSSRQPQDELAATRIPGRTLVTLTSVSDDDLGDELTVAWEVEPGRRAQPHHRPARRRTLAPGVMSVPSANIGDELHRMLRSSRYSDRDPERRRHHADRTPSD